MLERYMLCMALCHSVRLSACLSLTSRCSIKTTKHIITQEVVCDVADDDHEYPTCAADDKTATDTARCAVPLQQLSC